MERVCTQCQTGQPIEAFDIINARTGRRSPWCKRCRARQASAKYFEPSSGRRAGLKRAQELRGAINLAYMLRSLRDRPCVACGEDDPTLLRYNDLTRSNRLSVYLLAVGGYSLENMTVAMEKCRVLCTSCLPVGNRARDRAALECSLI